MGSEALQLVTAPAEEPVSRAEAKLYMRVDTTVEDEVIDGMIVSARKLAEAKLGHQLVTATYDRLLDSFPAGGAPILLPRPPLISVASVKYYDEDGVLQTLSDSRYELDVASRPGGVYLLPDYCWPGIQGGRHHAVQVRFDCGYGAAAAVPSNYKLAIKMLALALYDRRGEEHAGVPLHKISLNAAALLADERVGVIPS